MFALICCHPNDYECIMTCVLFRECNISIDVVIVDNRLHICFEIFWSDTIGGVRPWTSG